VSDRRDTQGRTASAPRTGNAAPKTLALFGMFGVGNLGNECTLEAMLHNIRRLLPDSDVCCICAGPDDTTLTYNVPTCDIREMPLAPVKNGMLRLLRRVLVGTATELLRWVKAIRRLKGTNMLIMTGTGMLSDLDIPPMGLHYDILRWSIAAKLARCKLMFVSVGAGPIRHPLSRFFLKMALKMADYRSYRDAFSKNYLEAMGVPTGGDTVYPDLVFSFPKEMLPGTRNCDRRRTVVGIGLIAHDNKRTGVAHRAALYEDYISKLGRFVKWLIENHYSVRLLVGDPAYDSRATQDLKAVLERSGVRYEQTQLMDEPARSVDDLLSQLAGTDLVVASRFHNVLLALMLRKPVVAISFHEKVDSLMSAMGFMQFRQDIQHVDVDKLIDQFTTLEANSEGIRRDLERKSEVYRRDLEAQYEVILNQG
jgi:polysaccharide pyruvyl transferase WcaK-like protein